MTFPDSEIEDAWERSGGKCECRKPSHNHPFIRCNKQLVWENRDNGNTSGNWKVYRVVTGGPPTKSNCMILCFECYRLTISHEKI